MRTPADRVRETLNVSTREAWRAWLARHHAAASGVWLRYAKRHTGGPRVEYDAAVEEALCLGWIDGVVRTVDERYYAQRFTPRRPGSNWSAINRRRFAKLLREGRVTEAGLAKAPLKAGQRDEERRTDREPVVPLSFGGH
jgi:uncharacterized protein YdeI (YjbR/CyaY-like superfamily)